MQQRLSRETLGAGRISPLDYRYHPSEFDRVPEIETDVLYVVGGLYGNLAALDTVEQLAAAERATVTIVLNGDFHWFDDEPEWFGEVERRAANHVAIRGNVETEIARAVDTGAGCGCAYPASVDDGVIDRSNAIIEFLRCTAAMLAGVPQRLARLPRHLLARVGGARIGIVHGDATSLAGWGFDAGALDDPANRAMLADVRRTSRVDVFASTHTCLPALRKFVFPAGELTVINNGSAGMPNFGGTRFGLLSRIATTASPHPALYGTQCADARVEAIAIPYDSESFLRRFLRRWPEGSEAHRSYHGRMLDGPDYALAQAHAGRP
jgi:predicted phosphodiesterase